MTEKEKAYLRKAPEYQCCYYAAEVLTKHQVKEPDKQTSEQKAIRLLRALKDFKKFEVFYKNKFSPEFLKLFCIDSGLTEEETNKYIQEIFTK